MRAAGVVRVEVRVQRAHLHAECSVGSSLGWKAWRAAGVTLATNTV